MKTEPVVSTAWLNQHLHDPDLVILDGSIAKVGQIEPHPLADFRIPRARFFDINGIFSDHSTDLPHNLPTPEIFSQGCQQLAINHDSRIVIYDHHGVYSSPRVWWMFRAMGHDSVSVLDGGLPKWFEEGLPVEPVSDNVNGIGDFTARRVTDLISDSNCILENLQTSAAKVLDARPSGRFCGTSPEPRQGLHRGHIPDSINLPADQVVRDGQFLPREELAAKLNQLELGDSRLIFSCGSGITACIIMLASELVLPNPKSVYDGSWAEWGQPDKQFPIEPSAN